MCAMPEELTNAEQTPLESALPQELPEAKKIQLAAAIAAGQSVAAWSRANGVPRSTAYDWASEPGVRRTVEACRRRTLDRAIGRMNRRIPWACDRIAELAKTAESESLRFKALRAMVANVMSVGKFSNLDSRVTQLEEDYGAQPGCPDRGA